MSRYKYFPFELSMDVCKEIAFSSEASYGDYLETIWYRYPDGVYGNRRYLDITDKNNKQ